eukprot:CAMPEP_0169191964 /NCGR_PEP_ID=MMETSP1016-20121227/5352_1 /TAXON_ID=342587 /ORGANISM="Karlodinium micrum, Strain CCMP2283" /LENGTH=98 /DNA_ID=CAMNT_0009268253 /DNA_START=603 /DNA_END=899 /DNA_ORIENTATION=-
MMLASKLDSDGVERQEETLFVDIVVATFIFKQPGGAEFDLFRTGCAFSQSTISMKVFFKVKSYSRLGASAEPTAMVWIADGVLLSAAADAMNGECLSG